MGHDDFGSRKGRRSFMPIKARKTYSGRVGLVIRCLSIGSRALLHAFFRPHLAMTPLRFANPSPPSGWIEDFHLQAVVHTRHTRMDCFASLAMTGASMKIPRARQDAH